MPTTRGKFLGFLKENLKSMTDALQKRGTCLQEMGLIRSGKNLDFRKLEIERRDSFKPGSIN